MYDPKPQEPTGWAKKAEDAGALIVSLAIAHWFLALLFAVVGVSVPTFSAW